MKSMPSISLTRRLQYLARALANLNSCESQVSNDDAAAQSFRIAQSHECRRRALKGLAFSVTTGNNLAERQLFFARVCDAGMGFRAVYATEAPSVFDQGRRIPKASDVGMKREFAIQPELWISLAQEEAHE